jgi:hypothetical protein
MGMGMAMRCDVTQTVDFPIRSGCEYFVPVPFNGWLRGTGVALLVNF